MNEMNEIKNKIVDVCEGNPGALSVLVLLMGAPTVIDFLHLHGPKGSALWVLYKDECGESMERLVEVLAARMSEWYVQGVRNWRTGHDLRVHVQVRANRVVGAGVTRPGVGADPGRCSGGHPSWSCCYGIGVRVPRRPK